MTLTHCPTSCSSTQALAVITCCLRNDLLPSRHGTEQEFTGAQREGRRGWGGGRETTSLSHALPYYWAHEIETISPITALVQSPSTYVGSVSQSFMCSTHHFTTHKTGRHKVILIRYPSVVKNNNSLLSSSRAQKLSVSAFTE